MSALPIGPWFQIADLNVGLLFILGNQRARNFRNRAWRMGFEQPLLAARCAAQRGATGELRNGGGHGDWLAALLLAGTLSTREIVQAQDDYGIWFIFAAPVGFFIYMVGVDRGNQSRAVRFAGSGIGTRRRLHDGIQRFPLGALFPGGIHEHDCRRVDRDDAVSWRLAAAVCALARSFPGRLSNFSTSSRRSMLVVGALLLLSRAEAAGASAENCAWSACRSGFAWCWRLRWRIPVACFACGDGRGCTARSGSW